MRAIAVTLVITLSFFADCARGAKLREVSDHLTVLTPQGGELYSTDLNPWPYISNVIVLTLTLD